MDRINGDWKMNKDLELIKLKILAYLTTSEERIKPSKDSDDYNYYLGCKKTCEFLFGIVNKKESLTVLKLEIDELLVLAENKLDTYDDGDYHYYRGCELVCERLTNDIKAL